MKTPPDAKQDRRGWFLSLRQHLIHLIHSVELTQEEGNALIDEIRMRVRTKDGA